LRRLSAVALLLSFDNSLKSFVCSSTFINTVLTLWAFRVSEDPEHPIDTLAFTESANAHPLPFKVGVTPLLCTTGLTLGLFAIQVRFEPRFNFDDDVLGRMGKLKEMMEGYGEVPA
jgi:hypothetical protein